MVHQGAKPVLHRPNSTESNPCSIMEKPHTGLDDCLNMLLSCFKNRIYANSTASRQVQRKVARWKEAWDRFAWCYAWRCLVPRVLKTPSDVPRTDNFRTRTTATSSTTARTATHIRRTARRAPSMTTVSSNTPTNYRIDFVVVKRIMKQKIALDVTALFDIMASTFQVV